MYDLCDIVMVCVCVCVCDRELLVVCYDGVIVYNDVV